MSWKDDDSVPPTLLAFFFHPSVSLCDLGLFSHPGLTKLICQMEHFPNLLDLFHKSIWERAHKNVREMLSKKLGRLLAEPSVFHIQRRTGQIFPRSVERVCKQHKA